MSVIATSPGFEYEVIDSEALVWEPPLEKQVYLELQTQKRLSNKLRAKLAEAESKFCYSCSGIQPLKRFFKGESRCKSCVHFAKAAYDAENREAIRESQRARYQPVLKAPCYPVTSKVCPGCSTDKPWTDYAANRSNWNGLDSRCRACRAGYYQECKTERDEYTNNYRRSVNPWASKLSAGYARAVKEGLPAEKITTKQLLEFWESVGIDSERSAYSGRLLWDGTVSLDHIVPLSSPDSPGHVLSNLVPCLWEENNAKNTGHFIHLLGRIHNAD
ncbi:hypothetical protein HMPREF3169_05250 [Corynebacterium sp. HMSC08C04]|uniref:hypothetical protein n=1 Tax=Corynebacterium sp. HMSC08C04 TaxID=1581137 RepID=UPI0008A49229|nr:hypothetical protein [Corynebacterium sp. HMSC08C04]OFT34650.1 hypothetical protein HMPREF3169_05250 [Corynebacterium sp. HMSC08C04]